MSRAPAGSWGCFFHGFFLLAGWPVAGGEHRMAILRIERTCSAKLSLKSRRVAVALLTFLGALGQAPPGAPAPAHGEPGPITIENARSRYPQCELANPAWAHEIEGYAAGTSVAPGDTLRLYVSSKSPTFAVEVFRMGWYGGAGARRVLELRALSGGQRAIPKPRGDDGLVE